MSVTINGTTGIDKVLPDTVPQSEVVQDIGPWGFRNKLINGGFDIWQRATSQTTSGYGSDDRWRNDVTGSTQVHSQQAFTPGQTDVPGNPKYFSRTVVSSVAGSSNNAIKQQVIEDVSRLSGKTVTLSFYAKADSSKNIAVDLFQYFGASGSAAVSGIGVTKILLSTSWEKYTVTADIPSVLGKTISVGNDATGVVFWFDAGSDFDDRTDSLGQQSGTFDIANVQLEEGTEATEFEQRPIGLEVSLCRRYYQKINATYTVGNVYRDATTSLVLISNTSLTQFMRVSPTVTHDTLSLSNCYDGEWLPTTNSLTYRAKITAMGYSRAYVAGYIYLDAEL